MAKAKLNTNQVKGVASKAGAPIPPKPRVQSPEQLKKQAKERAKKRVKMLVRALIVIASLAAIALVVYFVKFHGRMPKDALKSAIEYAYEDNATRFKHYFTSDSIKLVDNGNEDNIEQWERLMDGITPIGTKPRVLTEKIEERNKIKTAEVTIDIDGEQHTVYMRQEEGKWLINLNVALDPRHLTLPEDIPAEYLDNFDLSDEPEAWWENPEPEEETGAKGFFSSIFSGKGGSKAPAKGASSSKFKLF